MKVERVNIQRSLKNNRKQIKQLNLFGRGLGCLGHNLGSIWGVLVVSWHPFWGSGGRLWSIFVHQGVFWSPLATHGAILLPLWPPKGLHSAPLGPPRRVFGVIV